MRPKILAARVVTKQDARLATIHNFIVAHRIVGIAMPDGDSIIAIATNLILFRQAEFTPPTPKNPLAVAFQAILRTIGRCEPDPG